MSEKVSSCSAVLGTGMSRASAHSASVLLIVCSTIVILFLFFKYLKGEIKERVGVRTEGRKELKNIDTNSQKPVNKLQHLFERTESKVQPYTES